MTTTMDLIQETRARLYAGSEERANRLDGAITNVATTLTLKYSTTGIAPGTVITIDLEEIRVWEISGQNVTVAERAVNGSVAAAHSDLAYIAVASKFSPWRILRAINEDLLSLSSPLNGLYQMVQTEVTFNPSVSGYDLTGVTSLDDIWRVEAKYTGLPNDWTTLSRWRVDRGANTTDFPSGFGLFLGEGGQPGQPVRVWYRAPFTTLSTTSTTVDISTTGLPTSAYDLPPLGVLVRLVPPRDIKRSFTESQGEPRRAQEVPPNTATQSVTGISRFRQQRIAEEAARLARQYPPRSRAA